MRSAEKEKVKSKLEESDYDSAEDEDFKEDDNFAQSSSDESDAGAKKKGKRKDLDSGDEATINKGKKKQKSEKENDRLILTRAQRKAQTEEEASTPTEKAVSKNDKPEDLDAMWQQLNAEPEGVLVTGVRGFVMTGDTIRIARTYEFAGQIVDEEKEVPRDSAEAKAYLSSLHVSIPPSSLPSGVEVSTKPTTRRPVKRASKLEAMAQSSKPQKLNVLEKSRLDWAGFVDKEGINDDLKRHNRDGYVERQEFLKRAR